MLSTRLGAARIAEAYSTYSKFRHREVDTTRTSNGSGGNSLQVSPRRTSGYLDDLPSRSQLVLDPHDDGSVVTLFHPVLSPNDDLTRLGILETEDFLCRECHNGHRYFVLEHLSSRDLRKGVDQVMRTRKQVPSALTSTCRMSRTLLALMRPLLRYTSILAQRTLYVCLGSCQPHDLLVISDKASYSFATLLLQTLLIRTQICVDHLWHDVFPQLPLEVLPVEIGIHVFHHSQHLRYLVLVEPRADCVRDGPETRSERVFGLVVSLFEFGECPQDRIGGFHVLPCLLTCGELVYHH